MSPVIVVLWMKILRFRKNRDTLASSYNWSVEELDLNVNVSDPKVYCFFYLMLIKRYD